MCHIDRSIQLDACVPTRAQQHQHAWAEPGDRHVQEERCVDALQPKLCGELVDALFETAN